VRNVPRQALLELDWPALLLTTKAAGEVWGALERQESQKDMAALDDNMLIELQQLALFRGLRVLMGVHTGSNYIMSRHPVTGGSPSVRSPLESCFS
jgi:hypothetical protein